MPFNLIINELANSLHVTEIIIQEPCAYQEEIRKYLNASWKKDNDIYFDKSYAKNISQRPISR